MDVLQNAGDATLLPSRGQERPVRRHGGSVARYREPSQRPVCADRDFRFGSFAAVDRLRHSGG